jgi:hypothetical protein
MIRKTEIRELKTKNRFSSDKHIFFTSLIELTLVCFA